MRRVCDSCKTPLPGKKQHGFVTRRGGLVCGRTKVQKSVKLSDGTLILKEDAPMPRECRAW